MSVSSSPMKSVSMAYMETVKEEEKDKVVSEKRYCWPCCRKPQKPAHERALTQHELDYARIVKIEAAQRKALEVKK